MNDSISRQAAIGIIQGLYPGMPRVPWLRKDWQERYEPYINAEKAIRTLPSAQPERKNGRWEMKPDPFGFFGEIPVCSECGCTTKMRDKTKFCPHCGAQMEGQ